MPRIKCLGCIVSLPIVNILSENPVKNDVFFIECRSKDIKKNARPSSLHL